MRKYEKSSYFLQILSFSLRNIKEAYISAVFYREVTKNVTLFSDLIVFTEIYEKSVNVLQISLFC